MVTLIARPRCFGKMLTMSMAEQFFSAAYADNQCFQDMDIWKEKKYRDHVYGGSITNFEVLIILKKMVRSCFVPSSSNYNAFVLTGQIP